MTANIRTTSLFDGKVYAKGSPVTCMKDVDGELAFSITMRYNDQECGIKREGLGGYINEVIIQHHDSIVTSADLGLQLSCEYDLTNKSVSNDVDLSITGEISPSLFEESVVDSPNVVMRVANENGQDTKTAVVGDPLLMVWEILDPESPYEIFVRDLIAVDGATDTELVLVDERGCPTDAAIMGEVRKGGANNKTLSSKFDAFRFPTSDVVQFRAMITPCLPTCEPVVCDVLDYTGQTKAINSYGRRKRREATTAGSSTYELDIFGNVRRIKRATKPEEVLVVQSLKIVDRYGKRKEQEQAELQIRNRKLDDETSSLSTSADSSFGIDLLAEDIVKGNPLGGGGSADCLDKTSMIVGAVVFLVAQLAIVVLFALIWRRNQRQADKGLSQLESRSDSLSYMYDAGFARRVQ
jgi:hypothetical protein